MTILTVAVLTALAYLILVPLGMQLVTSFRGPVTSLPFETSARWTFDNFATPFLRGGLIRTIRDTGIFVGGSVAVSCALGFTFAWLVERTNLPKRSLIFTALLVPAIMPGLVHAQAWIIMLAPVNGLINRWIRFLIPLWETGPINPFSFPGMILVQGLAGVTFFFLLLTAVLRSMDGALEEASRASGGNVWQTVRRVTIPLLMPGIIALVILNTIITMGQFEVPLLFGVSAGANIFSLRIWSALQPPAGGIPHYGTAAAYGVYFLLVTYGLFYLYSRITRQAGRFATIAGKGYRPTRLSLGVWKYAALLLIGAYLFITFVVPLFVLFWHSLFRFYTPMTWENLVGRATLDVYRVVLGDSKFWGGIWRSFAVAGISATVAVALAMVSAWVVVRGKRGPMTRSLDLFASSSIAIPSTVAAFSFFIFYLVVGKWIPIFGTIWILVLAYSFRTSVAYRTSYAGVLQINRELEEASSASGASRLSTLRRIVVPLLLPHATVVWLHLFLLGTHEFTIALFLATEKSATLPVVLFERMATSGGSAAQAAAMAVLYTLTMLVVAGTIRIFTLRRGVRQIDAA